MGFPKSLKTASNFCGRKVGMVLFLSPRRLIRIVTPGLTEEGLFRRSPQSALLKTAQEAYDRGACTVHPLCQFLPLTFLPLGNVVSLDNFNDPHLAAVLLKKYLRDLPEPIFPQAMYPLIRKCPTPTGDPSDVGSITYIRETLLPAILPCAYILLSQVLRMYLSAPSWINHS